MFIAAFERSGPGSRMGATFDSTISEPNAKINHGLWFCVPGGTFMLGVAADKAQEKQVLKLKDRFFNSLNFE